MSEQFVYTIGAFLREEHARRWKDYSFPQPRETELFILINRAVRRAAVRLRRRRS